MTDVLIIGCGPAGALLASFLGEAGLDVMVLDRATGVIEIPRAVHIDGETMRVMQAAGVGSELLPLLRPGQHGMHWVNADGQTLAIREGEAGLSDQGWHNDYYFHQPELEKVLRTRLAHLQNVTLREGVEATRYAKEEDGVCVDTLVLATGQRESLRTRYVVGCDGARSIVRQWIGTALEDLGMHQPWLVVDAQLHRPLDLPEHTIQYCDPARPATSIYVHPLRRRWEIMLRDGDDLVAATEPENVWKLLAPWIKPSQGTLERAATYVFHSLVAEDWQRGRLFIAGDAAHQTPPFLGQGLCAGARDVANLAWKLALAVRHPADVSILDTYGSERKPHAREFIALAVKMGRIIQETDPEAAAVRDADLKSKGLSFRFPRPTLGPGVHTGKGGPVGKVFCQPILPDGHWLDDVAGQRFALIIDHAQEASLEPELVHELDNLGIMLIRDAGSRAQRWFAEQHQCAVLLRPDHYVFDALENLSGLPATLAELRAWICQ